MSSTRIVFAVAAAAIAVVLAIASATAQTAAGDQPGKPLSLLAGLRPPHQAKAVAHAKTARRTIKKARARKLAAKTTSKLPGREHNKIAAMRSEQPTAPTQPAALPPNVWPGVGITPPADIAAAASSESAPPDNVPQVSDLVVNGETVQIASPDKINAIDLAANDDATKTVTPGNRADTTPAVQGVFAAPIHKDANQTASSVGSASWIAQVLAALGGAVAAGSVAWFLIGSGPQRMYG